MTKLMLSRRVFLTAGGVVAAGFGFGPRFLLRAAAAQARRKRVLIGIFQRGAVDGLNMVIPYAEAAYYRLRPTIAVPRPGTGTGASLDLDGQFALHPELSGLQPFFAAGELAVVHACGSHDPTRSHFDAQDYMETGLPGEKSGADGWLNRHLQSLPALDASVFRGMAMTGTVPRILAGPAEVLSITALRQLQLGRGRRGEITNVALTRMYGAREDLLGLTMREGLEATTIAQGLDPENYQPSNGAVYPQSDLGSALRELAQLIKADVGLEIGFADIGGWDTHSFQGSSEGNLATLLRDLADCLVAFRTDLGEQFADVCVVTMSEFGRTVAENGSLGSDHGHGTALLVFGGTVAGGRVYGHWPGLDETALFEGRDLAVTTDFRALFAELADRHLENSSLDAIFPGFTYDASTRLGVIA